MSSEVRRARIWLSAGALLGIALGARGVLRPARAASTLPEGAVALVGDAPIASAEYARALSAVEGDLRAHHADPAMRRHVLDRLIDEELLVQRALELGLPTREPRLRGQIASAMIDGVVGGAGAPPPGEADLRAFHATHPELFSRRARVAVEALFFRGDVSAALGRAGAARARIEAGEPFAALASAADAPPVDIPRGLMPVTKLGEYVGLDVARAMAATPPGEINASLPTGGGVWMARVVAGEAGALTPFDDVRGEVLAELRREQDDARLRRWLDQRRAQTRVVLREPLP